MIVAFNLNLHRYVAVSKARKGDARQLNKMIRASRADHVLVLTEVGAPVNVDSP
jgi:hypothetical protein